MDDRADTSTAVKAVDVVLEGGPMDLPDLLRRQRVDPVEYDIKVHHRGGYEHFVRTTEWSYRHGTPRIVYRWSFRTRIAE